MLTNAGKPCKHGLITAECGPCSGAIEALKARHKMQQTANGAPALHTWEHANRLEKGVMLRELVRELGRDASPKDVLAEAVKRGWHRVAIGSVYKFREALGFTSGAKKGKATKPKAAKADPKPAAAAPPDDESPLISVAELGEFVRLVRSITPAVARQLLDVVA